MFTIIDGIVKIFDKDGNGLTSSDLGSGVRALDINIENQPTIDVDSLPDIILRDGTNAAQKAVVDASGNVYVKVEGLVFDGNNLQVSVENQPTVEIGNQPTVDVNSLPDIIIRDGTNAARKAVVDDNGNIYTKVEGLIFNGDNLQVSVENQPTVDVNSIPDIILRDGVNASYKAEIDSAKRIQARVFLADRNNSSLMAKIDESGNIYTVTPAPETPAGKTGIEDIQQDDVSGTDNSYVTIPTGENIVVQRLKAGSEMDSVAGSAVELYYAPNGNTTGIVLLDALYVNGESDHSDLNYQTETGDGTKSILLRRRRLGGGSIEIFAKWEGYY